MKTKNTVSSLTNRAATKRFLLDTAKKLRPFHPFNRVSEDALEYLETKLRATAIEMIRRHPSIGKTIKP